MSVSVSGLTQQYPRVGESVSKLECEYERKCMCIRLLIFRRASAPVWGGKAVGVVAGATGGHAPPGLQALCLGVILEPRIL